MAVFTPVTEKEVEALLAGYALGRLVRLEAIGQGIENSNYFVTTDLDGREARWVLTLFETLKKEELPFFMEYMTVLASQGLPVPAPVPDLNSQTIQLLASRPAVLFPCLTGHEIKEPGVLQCQQVGIMVARLHQVKHVGHLTRPPVRTVRWMYSNYHKLCQQSSFGDQALLERVIDYIETRQGGWKQCRVGLVHGDLFRDNLLFSGDRITGLIDFYHACEDYLLFDLAVAANEWCFDMVRGEYDQARITSLVQSYQSIAGWPESSQACWPDFLLLAATRFWISRLVSWHLPGYQGNAVQGNIAKSPDEYRLKVEAILAAFDLGC
ncbi:MAG: homoserine kinase [Proteobacteria bacterium]|nr:MAG: homoserine kinase [Pseudomonadota bacterium]PIE39889.1 MAG: homoserine kinase [Gammaproteobacteria bacterium]